MDRDGLKELYYIAPVSNIASIMAHGILSHRLASMVKHASVAMEEIQSRRANKVIPGGRPLHDYANLYICVRNPTLCKLADTHQGLCVLGISTEVLDIEGTVVCDMNAACYFARFAPAPEGLSIVDDALTFAKYWTDEDPIVAGRKKGAKCAEVLVPHRIETRFILRAYVSCDQARAALEKMGLGIPIRVEPYLFFR